MHEPPDGPFGTWLGKERRDIDEALFASDLDNLKPMLQPEEIQELLAEEPQLEWPVFQINPIVDGSPCDEDIPPMDNHGSVAGWVSDDAGRHELHGVAPGVFEVNPNGAAISLPDEEPMPTIDFPECLPCEVEPEYSSDILPVPVPIEVREVLLPPVCEVEQTPRIVPEVVSPSGQEMPCGLGEAISIEPMPVCQEQPVPHSAQSAAIDESTAKDSAEPGVVAQDEEPVPTTASSPLSAAEPRRSVSFELIHNRTLSVTEGATAPLTPWHLCLKCSQAEHPIELMLLIPPAHGTLLSEGFALCEGDVFTQQDIEQGRIVYRQEANQQTTDAFTFATTDGHIEQQFLIEIRPGHRAPVLTGVGELGDVQAGSSVSAILKGCVRCCNSELVAGMAVVALGGRGRWQYSLDAGHHWQTMSDIQHDRALLLGPDTRIRFEPALGWSGRARLSYRAWDQSEGRTGARVDLTDSESVGGSTPFSAQVTTVSATIQPIVSGTPTGDPWVSSPTVGELLGGPIAVVWLQGQGIWQFSLDEGRTWTDFGTVYHGRARLLGAEDCIRFLPFPQAQGKIQLIARSWDGETGTRGSIVNLAGRSAVGENTPFGEFAQSRTWRLPIDPRT